MTRAACFLVVLIMLAPGCSAPYAMTLDQQSDFDSVQAWIRARPADPTPAPRLALLADAGTWPAGAHAIVAALEAAGMPCHVQDHSLLTRKSLQRFDTLILPGGWAPLQRAAATPEGLHAIETFVQDGGTCIGVCAGAYLLSHTVIWDHETFAYPLGLFDGTAEGPLNDYPKPHAARLTLTAAGERAGLPPARAYYLNGGGGFRGGSDITTLATFSDGLPAIISRPCQKGRIILLAIHPEHAAPPATSNDPPVDTAAIYLSLLKR